MRDYRPKIGVTLEYGTAALCGVMFLYIGISWYFPQLPGAFEHTNWVYHIAFWPVFFGLLFVGMHGRRLRHPPAEVVLAQDTRPPVLYLRSFRHDRYDTDAYGLAAASMLLNAHGLIAAFRPIGPVFCIAKPDEPLPPATIPRMFVPHAEWKQRVEHYKGVSRAIIVIGDDTEGLHWELHNYRTSHDPAKLLLGVPGSRYDKLSDFISTALQIKLPPKSEFIPHTLSESLFDGQCIAFMHFTPAWTALPLPVVHQPSRQSQPFDMDATLRPFTHRIQSVFPNGTNVASQDGAHIGSA
jgi:hypothetical protein